VFLVASKLGITSFGGPVAHLGYFRREYVQLRGWLDEGTYAEIVALCQSLPGPASTQTGIAIGLLRAGPLGAFAAWLGFTLPSVVLMFAFAYLDRLPLELGWLFPILRLVAFAMPALSAIIVLTGVLRGAGDTRFPILLTWIGFVAPRGVDKAIVAKLNQELVRILQLRETREQLSGVGMTVIASSPEEFAKVVKDDSAKFGRIIKSAGIRLD